MSATRIAAYDRKRDFSKTPEPEGITEESIPGKLRFVIQKHAASHLHYDFRLEMRGTMKSWAVPKGPSTDPSVKRLAMMVEDHPLSYRTFEGIIPQGEYGGGTVMVWDEGTYTSLENSDNEEKELLTGLHKGNIKFVMYGKKMHGAYALVKLHTGEENAWLLIKEKDEFVSKHDITKQDLSVQTGRNLEEIAEKKKTHEAAVTLLPPSTPKMKMPEKITPMLATLVDKPFDRSGWAFEIKWDGYRVVAFIQNGKVRLTSRNQQNYTDKFGEISDALTMMDHDVILDGEVVVLDKDGKPHFQDLQNHDSASGLLTYVIFDILYLDGNDLRSLPLLERKEHLRSLQISLPYVLVTDFITEKGEAFYHEAVKNGLEGIVAKDSTSPYQEGARNENWLKIKSEMRQEAIICGFTEPRGGRKKFGALVLGIYDNELLKYIGHTGGGFDHNDLAEIHDILKPLIRKTSPFAHPPKTNTPVTWIEPKLLCEVKFSNWTDDEQMRHPVFLGLRDNKNPKAVKHERTEKVAEVIDAKKQIEVPITNPDKIYFPKEKYTKGDLLDYYKEITPVMFPYLKDRLQSMNRFPNGIAGAHFYQKDLEQHPDWVKTMPVYSESDEKNIDYLLCDRPEVILYMANLGCIEINPWNSRITSLENPDYLILDLDPEDIGFDAVVKTAQVIHTLLEKYSIQSLVKTSGKTGIHIMIPLGARYNYDQTKQFAQLLATLAHEKLPDITSLERSPSNRQKKVYIDYLQNRVGQTIAAAYSVRPVEGACVSTPLKWEEVNEKLDPTKFTIRSIMNRLDKTGDLFGDVLECDIDLGEVLSKIKL